MALDSLPNRPLAHDDVAVLDAAGAFAAVRPVNAFHFPERDTRLVTALILVTGTGLRAVEYDPTTREWTVVRTEALDDPDGLEDVPDELLATVQGELEDRVSELEEAGVVGQPAARDGDVEVRDATSLGTVLYEQYTD
ncbi:hypothetical protein GCM10009037_15960 [Halarchaeum grantii]|uniref:DUF7964 domain-containing protein n=1 Tax=Halarchaeum grantii TaxID=1193105 RepID=A0A830F2J7_9EURY|nr:hypothetical protein [Halarchaeum grantii]GGL33129.1 hypothetical protein GCM10009037_15960 [Halarchaeum grantii]